MGDLEGMAMAPPTGSTHGAVLDGDTLVLGPVCVRFMRTLRIPESGISALPPGLGTFPLRRVADYPDTAPASWLARGGVMLPIYLREAMWLALHSQEPSALQVAVGKVCAVSGKGWDQRLATDPQNYLALPEQPWLDGINSGDGLIRQFVAVPLGSGATVEEQVTGAAEHGGVQLRAVGLTSKARQAWERKQRAKKSRPRMATQLDAMAMPMAAAPTPDMGLGAGGQMRQEVYADRRPMSDYDQSESWRVFVHLCSAATWASITGELPPATPVDRDAYTSAGLPWFDYFDAELDDLPPAETLTRVKPVGEVLGLPDHGILPVPPGQVVKLKDGREVTDGDW